MIEGDRLATSSGDWATVGGVSTSGIFSTVYNVRVSEYHTYFVGSITWGFSVWAHNVTPCVRTNLNNNDATANFGIYQIYIFSNLYKIGKADLGRITQSSGLPTRLHQQIRKLEQIHGPGSVQQVLENLGKTTTRAAKAIENIRIRSIFEKTGVVPPGNIKSFKVLDPSQ